MVRSRDPRELVSRLLRRERGGLAQLLTLAESDPAAYETIAEEVQAASTGALRVGVTGAGGVGKSTLLSVLADRIAATGERVAVLATDPTSAVSGGALLGDRVRWSAAADRLRLFFRSVAHRGGEGGLAPAVHDLMDLLDAFGFEVIFLEAVGAGQTEVEISSATDLTMVVLAPQSGDVVQAMKAGLMEAGDIFVINKRDLPGGDQAEESVRYALELRASHNTETAPVVIATSALRGEGTDRLVEILRERAAMLRQRGELALRRRQRMVRRVRRIVLRLLGERLLETGALEALVEERGERVSPQRLARELVEQVFPEKSGRSPGVIA